MGNVVYGVTAVFQLLVFLITMYYLVLGFIGLGRKKDIKDYTPKKKFAMLVAAHNEEVVISGIVDSMAKLN